MNEKTENKGLNISVRSFITAIGVLLVLMIVTYILTCVIPGGAFPRISDGSGNLIIDTQGSFQNVQGGLPFWKWLCSPFLVLTADGSVTIIAVIAFLLIMGGAFNALTQCGLMQYMLDKIVHRFGRKRYQLLAVVSLFFMAMGSFIGSFEEAVPMVPIVVALSIGLGWDTLTGLGMSLLSIGCGFAAGVCNPFTIGVSQKLAGLPMFSGLWYRLVAFVLIYVLLMFFLYRYAKKIERPIKEIESRTFEKNKKMDRGLIAFALLLGAGILLTLSSAVITVLQDYTLIIVTIMFFLAGIVSTLIAGMKLKELGRSFLSGIISMLPGVLMILMASSIKYTLEEAHILDTILHAIVGIAGNIPRWSIILFIYFVALVMNFFISSGSAKAFLLMPLIIPMAQLFSIPAQLCVMAYAFGDGFSNVFYPTNPVLLVSLGLTGENYGSWAKWSGKFQLLNLVLTSLLLLIGLAIGYA